MLSLFSSFFDYSTLIVAVLRIVVAIIFIAEGYRTFQKQSRFSAKKLLSAVEFVGGVFLLAGLFTQAIAVVLAVVSIKKTYLEYKNESSAGKNISFYILLFFVSLSFLFLGPGLWSIDYPL